MKPSPLIPRRLLVMLVLTLAAHIAMATPDNVSVARPATIAVTTAADELNVDGDCSLREALHAANTDQPVDGCVAGSGADVILVPAALYSLSLAGAAEDAGLTGDLDVSSALVLRGAGASGTVIDGAQLDRVLHIAPAAAVTVEHVTIRNGRGDQQGGGIWNQGSLVLASAVITGNHALGRVGSYAGVGGGIVNDGSLMIRYSLISHNEAESVCYEEGCYDGIPSFGGGIASRGALTITSSAVVDNVAALGGGIWQKQGSAELALSLIARNSAQAGFGREASGFGGGLLTDAGTVTRVVSSTVADNRTYSTCYGSTSGGGISNGGELTLVDSTVSGNSAPNGCWSQGSGGGIANNGLITMLNSTISGNIAGGVDGPGVAGLMNIGTARIESSTIANNRSDPPGAHYTGGIGIYALSGTLTMKNSILAGNRDAAGAAMDCAGNITSEGYNLIESPADCTLEGVTTGNLLGVSARLEPLAHNGGPTLTHALRDGSPAIDAGSDTECPAADQRGARRPVDGDDDDTAVCDIGAYELQPGSAKSYFVYLPAVMYAP